MPTIIVGLLVAILFISVLVHMIKQKKMTGSITGCNCKNCANSKYCNKDDKNI